MHWPSYHFVLSDILSLNLDLDLDCFAVYCTVGGSLDCLSLVVPQHVTESICEWVGIANWNRFLVSFVFDVLFFSGCLLTCYYHCHCLKILPWRPWEKCHTTLFKLRFHETRSERKQLSFCFIDWISAS